MEFPANYFEDEDRCGFLVPAQMKRCWAAALEVLDDIAQVCERHNLEWFAGWGTLLGAIRHAGFIPWDDDLDIYMKRRDYEIFLKVAEQELPDNYSLLNSHNDAGYDQFLTRVISGRNLALTPDNIRKYHGFRYITGVDIFPLDYISRNRQEDDLQQMIIQGCVGAFKALSDKKTSEEEREEAISLVEELTNVKINRDGSEAVQIFDCADKIMQLYDEDDADYITMMPLWVTYGNVRFPKEDFERSIWMPFEHVSIRVPIGYRNVLMSLYGSYWEYVRSWNAHDYPYYKDMERQVKEIFGYSPTVFPYNRTQLDACIRVRELIRGSWTSNDVKTVLFLPWKGYMWESMAGIYRASIDAGYRVIVSPVVFADRDLDRNPTEYYIDIDMIPPELELTAPADLDIPGLHPDVIFIQYPYDEYNDACVSDERYFARNLFRYTTELIYIPPFDVDDIYSDDLRGREFFPEFGIVPGVFYSDRVYLQSEILRDLYVREWTQLAGDDTASIWGDKIRCCGNTRDDEIMADVYSMFEMPDNWNEYITRDDGSVQDVIMYHPQTGLPASQGEIVLRKIEDDLEIFKRKRNDCAFLWYQDEALDQYFAEARPDLNSQYQQLKEKFINDHIGILDDSGDIVRAVTISRAYIGDPGSLIPIFKRAGRPVMVRTPNMLYSDSLQVTVGHMYPFKGTVLDNRFYFISTVYPGLYSIDTITGECKYVCDLPEINRLKNVAYGMLYAYEGRIYIIPSRARALAIFDPSDGSVETIDFWSEDECRENVYINYGIVSEGYVFLFKYGEDLVFRISISDHNVERRSGWGKELKHPFITCGCASDGENVYAGDILEDCLAVVHIDDFTVEIKPMPNCDTRFRGLAVNDDRIWMAPVSHGNMLGVRLDMDEEPISVDFKQIAARGVKAYYQDLIFIKDDIIIFPQYTSSFYRYSIRKGELKPEYLGLSGNYLKYRDPGIEGAIDSHAFIAGECIYVVLFQRSELLVYDCEKGVSRTIPLIMPDGLQEKAKLWIKEYLKGRNRSDSVYKEQRYFGLPDFIGYMKELSPEYAKQSEEPHVGLDILNDIRRCLL